MYVFLEFLDNKIKAILLHILLIPLISLTYNHNLGEITGQSKCWFIFLNLDHQLVDVDELGGGGDLGERRHTQDSAEPVVILD